MSSVPSEIPAREGGNATQSTIGYQPCSMHALFSSAGTPPPKYRNQYQYQELWTQYLDYDPKKCTTLTIRASHLDTSRTKVRTFFKQHLTLHIKNSAHALPTHSQKRRIEIEAVYCAHESSVHRSQTTKQHAANNTHNNLSTRTRVTTTKGNNLERMRTHGKRTQRLLDKHTRS